MLFALILFKQEKLKFQAGFGFDSNCSFRELVKSPLPSINSGNGENRILPQNAL
jgi:hypothetical protein